MYLAIDIGGTKTLLAVFDAQGKLVEQVKVATNHSYPQFLAELKELVNQRLKQHRFIAVCCAAPGLINQQTKTAVTFGNLPWHNAHLVRDLEDIWPHTPVFLQNDSKLAALYEAVSYPQYRKVLYVTVSTGIGTGLIIDGKWNEDLADTEAGQMMMEFEGEIQKWEDFASGHALVKRYKKRASEIDDPKIWQEFSKGLALGLHELTAVYRPQIIVIGGGVGAHYHKFAEFLEQELIGLSSEMVPAPHIVRAKRPEEAVVYGCYEYIKQNI